MAQHTFAEFMPMPVAYFALRIDTGDKRRETLHEISRAEIGQPGLRPRRIQKLIDAKGFHSKSTCQITCATFQMLMAFKLAAAAFIQHRHSPCLYVVRRLGADDH